jgi:hypothetical protein
MVELRQRWGLKKMKIAKDASKRVGQEKRRGRAELLVYPFTGHDQPKQTWQEKWLAKEENGSSGDNSGEEEVEVTSAKGESNQGSGSGNPESGTRNPGGKEDRWEEDPTWMDINMVFMKDITKLVLGAECAVFDKLENPGAHMKPLFIQGHLDRTSIGHMLMDGGASINILPLSLLKKVSHIEGDLKHTNLSLSNFAGDPMEAKGVICKELTVESKTMPTSFFVMDIKRRYNVLLQWD